jgi:alpha-1,3-rhamnosyltransferase
MTNPLVSLLIPCYNHELFLDDCLESILAQDYANIELLICDDCSPDNSYAKILSYEQRLKARFPRVEILKNEVNCGVTKNVNRMLALAKGVYVKTLASDDAMAPNAIGEMVNYLQNNPDTDVVIANGVTVSEQERYPRFTPQGKIYDTAPDFSKEGFFLRVARCNPISAPAAMVRKSVYETYGMYDENIKVEDYEFWLRILKDGQATFGFLDQPLLYYRINANSMTSATQNAGLADRRRRFHQSEMGTLQKFREAFPPEAFASIILEHIHTERCFAVSCKLWDWEAELKESWKTFDGWKDLPWKTRLGLHYQSLRQTVKKCITK